MFSDDISDITGTQKNSFRMLICKLASLFLLAPMIESTLLKHISVFSLQIFSKDHNSWPPRQPLLRAFVLVFIKKAFINDGVPLWILTWHVNWLDSPSISMTLVFHQRYPYELYFLSNRNSSFIKCFAYIKAFFQGETHFRIAFNLDYKKLLIFWKWYFLSLIFQLGW